jgi:site-specific recombinase XerD
LAVEPLWA